jgi:hypothetical protein
VKKLALEEIYAHPHTLDSVLASGEPVAVMRAGRAVAEFVPKKDAANTASPRKRGTTNFRARFLKMWGPDALKSQISVAEEFADIRRERNL